MKVFHKVSLKLMALIFLSRLHQNINEMGGGGDCVVSLRGYPS